MRKYSKVPSSDAARVLSRGGGQTSAPLPGGAQWSELSKLDSKQIDTHDRRICPYRATEAIFFSKNLAGS